MRILVAEDDVDLNEIIVKKLKAEGYAVDPCYDGRLALDLLTSADYDVAVMDIMMPVMDGFEVVKALRARKSSTPVIFLTARDAVKDRVRGLDMGANDYLVKPFSFDELMARIRVATRTTVGNSVNVYSVSDLTLDVEKHLVERGGEEIALTAREFALLEFLMRNKNKVLSRQKIEDNVWSYDYEGGTNLVDVYITYLRKKVDGDNEVKLIHTVRGVGYTLKEDV